MSHYVTEILMQLDKTDKNQVHLYYPTQNENKAYICSIYKDVLWDLFGEPNYGGIMVLLEKGGFVPYTLTLTLQS